MYAQILSQTNDQVSKLVAPVQKFNALVVGHLEKFIAFQLDAARSYSDLGVEQLRATLKVSDVSSLKSYVEQQNKVAAVVGKKISSDTETLVSLSKNFSSDVQKFAQEKVVALAPALAAKPAVAKKPTPRKSA